MNRKKKTAVHTQMSIDWLCVKIAMKIHKYASIKSSTSNLQTATLHYIYVQLFLFTTCNKIKHQNPYFPETDCSNNKQY